MSNTVSNAFDALKELVFNGAKLEPTSWEIDHEAADYFGATFRLGRLKIVFRKAKITPKKVGQFVTFWKRIENGPIRPYLVSDAVDFLLVMVQGENDSGLFIFPKEALAQHKITTTNAYPGKRAFRVYAPWEQAQSGQAQQSQRWQSKFYHNLEEEKPWSEALIKSIFCLEA